MSKRKHVKPACDRVRYGAAGKPWSREGWMGGCLPARKRLRWHWNLAARDPAPLWPQTAFFALSRSWNVPKGLTQSSGLFGRSVRPVLTGSTGRWRGPERRSRARERGGFRARTKRQAAERCEWTQSLEFVEKGDDAVRSVGMP
jgi:hypothetical protein